MPTYTSGNGAFTPATNTDNWTLDSQTAGVFGKVVAVLSLSRGGATTGSQPVTLGGHRPCLRRH